MSEEDRTIEEFKMIWDGCSKTERQEFLKRFVPHLDPLSIQTISHTRCERLRPGILAGLVQIFQGKWDGGDL